MLLDRIPPIRIPDIAGLKIIPARASFKHARILFDENAARWNEPQVAEAMRHSLAGGAEQFLPAALRVQGTV